MNSSAWSGCQWTAANISLLTFLALLQVDMPAHACAIYFKSSQSIEQAHRRILHGLRTGKIVGALKPLGQMVFRTTLEARDQDTGAPYLTEAVFKPRVEGDYNRIGPWKRGDWVYRGQGKSKMEVLVYITNRLVGEDMVPPAVYRRDLDIHVDSGGEFGDLHFTEGSLIYFVDPIELGHPSNQVLTREELNFRENLAFVFRNPDFQKGTNSGRGPHWTDGRLRGVLLDWSASESRMPGWNPPRESYVAPGPRRDAFRRLTLEDYTTAIAIGITSEEQVRRILRQRDLLIQMSEAVDRGQSALQPFASDPAD